MRPHTRTPILFTANKRHILGVDKSLLPERGLLFHSRRVEGLTFIELLIVIIIIGSLVGLSLPNLRKSFNSIQAENFSRQLQSNMNYFRDKSVIEGKVFCFKFNNNNQQYSVGLINSTKAIKVFAIPKEITVTLTKKTNTDNPAIFFYPDGRIDVVTLVVNSGGQDITLTTEGSFGKVKLRKD